MVQWKLPSSVSAFVQRAGRAGRQRDRTGLAVLLVEQAAYGVDIGQDVREAEATAKGLPKRGKKQNKKRGKEKETAGAEKPKRKTKEEAKAQRNAAQARGSKRGTRDGQSDAIFVKEQPVLDAEIDDEGLHVLVQTGVCRRKVLTEIYGNKPPSKCFHCGIVTDHASTYH